MAQWVKDLALSLLGLRVRLGCEFDPSPNNFQLQKIHPKKKRKKKEGKKKNKEDLKQFNSILEGTKRRDH